MADINPDDYYWFYTTKNGYKRREYRRIDTDAIVNDFIPPTISKHIKYGGECGKARPNDKKEIRYLESVDLDNIQDYKDWCIEHIADGSSELFYTIMCGKSLFPPEKAR